MFSHVDVPPPVPTARIGIVSSILSRVLLVATIVVVCAFGAYNAHESVAQGKQITQTLNIIKGITTGPSAKEGRALYTWYAQEFIAICAATPNCHSVPLPKDLP